MSESSNISEMNSYSPLQIEAKWQQYWAQKGSFAAVNLSQTESSPVSKPFYILDMFPYPSGSGLHVGHPLGYIASDIYARYMRHKGYNVLHPMGYDSFGLPAEQYAIQTGMHPEVTTEQNIQRYREQLDKMGFSFDWTREVRTSDPQYYKWTQFIFIKLFESWYNPTVNKAEPIGSLIQHFTNHGTQGFLDLKHQAFSAQEWNHFTEQEQQSILMHYRLAYLSDTYVNWCAALGTVLANDEVKDGYSERGGHPVERKKMKQWSLRITVYAERLLEGLHNLDWSDNIKEIQRNWIGKSYGAAIQFAIQGHTQTIEVFTTRPDTLFGVSYLTLAPELEWLHEIVSAEQKEAVEAYIEYAKNRSERERQSDVKHITGVFTGAYAVHPITQKALPIWVGDYVLANYGTGAVMAVPAHDDRDFAFAKHFNLPIVQVIEPPQDCNLELSAWTEKRGKLVHSDFLNGLEVPEAIKAMIQMLEKQNMGKGKVNYRLRDAVFGRQRYWGEPIPIYYNQNIPYALNPEHLPLILPKVDAFLPTKTGLPPLARAQNWRYNPQKGVVLSESDGFAIEQTTMPGWAGSSWYFFRYMDPNNPNELASGKQLEYWKQVDLYMGGAEHATGHLLYARFWTHFLHDLGIVPVLEPFKKLVNQGMVQGESAVIYRDVKTNQFISSDCIEPNHALSEVHIDVALVNGNEVDLEKLQCWRSDFQNATFIKGPKGFLCSRVVEKMSKSKWNVVNPDDICDQYGADTLRMYEMFLGPLEDAKPWSTQGIEGVYKFLKKFWKMFHLHNQGFELSEEAPTKPELKILHKTIKKVSSDIIQLSLNTSVSAFMICINELQSLSCNKRAILEPLLVLLSPFAPHITEELWSKCGHKESICRVPWPDFNDSYLQENDFQYPVSINGKMRTQMTFELSLDSESIKAQVLANEVVAKWIEGKPIKKFIYIPKKIINVVV